MGLASIIYKRIDKIKTKKGFLEKKYREYFPHVELVVNRGFTTINFIGKSQTRGQSTAKMLIDCLKTLNIEKDITLRFFINDKPKHGYEQNCFYYCIDDDKKRDCLIPDFAFESWAEAGINHFIETTEEIEQRGKQKWKDHRLGWIGNTKTNKIREKLMILSKEMPDSFDFNDTFVDDFIIHKKQVPYLSLPDHTKYKYLLDVEGNSYSARLKFLFFSQRVIFLQDRSWKEYFHYDLVPYKHFIPIKNDLSDLHDQYQKIEKDPELYEQIAQNALEFAHKHLTYQSAIEFMTKAIDMRIKEM